MQLHLLTRLGRQGPPPVCHGEQLLLEGEWPAAGSDKRSLNQQATARFAWIDGQVDFLHAQWLHALERTSAYPAELSSESLLALELRYYLVKLARFVAVVDELLSSGGFTTVTLWRSPASDGDYADLAGQLCRKWHTPLSTRDLAYPNEPSETPTPPTVQRCRVSLGRAALAARSLMRGAVKFVQRIDDGARAARGSAEPIMLCGAPAHLGPLVESLRMQTDAPVYWLCDGVSQRQYLRWRPRGVRFLSCNPPRGRAVTDQRAPWDQPADDRPYPLPFRETDFGPAVRRWLDQQWQRQGPRLRRCRARMEEQFRAIRPGWLVVDEDATPLKRLAVAVARQQAVPSAVVQHGAPYIAFGFAPLAADVIFAWGEASRRQFQRWGIPRDRIRVTGSPKHDVACATLPTRAARPVGRKKTSRHLVFFASVHHSDDRPDVVSLQFTAATNAEMVRMALRALRTLPECRLVIKLHPRTRDAEFFGKLLAEAPDLVQRVRIVRRCRNDRLVRGAACVLSCFSSAGIEAMLRGVPVIELMPAGSADLLRPGDWPLAGTARTQEELESCLAAVLSGATPAPTRRRIADVFANLERPAAPRVAAILGSKQDALSVGRSGPCTVEPTSSAGAVFT